MSNATTGTGNEEVMNETTNARIKVNGITAEDSTVICAFCGNPKHACTCSSTATVY